MSDKLFDEAIDLLTRALPFIHEVYLQGGIEGIENSADFQEKVSEFLKRAKETKEQRRQKMSDKHDKLNAADLCLVRGGPLCLNRGGPKAYNPCHLCKMEKDCPYEKEVLIFKNIVREMNTNGEI